MQNYDLNILLDNVNILSNTGPNSFGAKFVKYSKNHNICFDQDKKFNCQLSFIESTIEKQKLPIFLRLDGIYFNNLFDFSFFYYFTTCYWTADVLILWEEWLVP